jgi:ferredoxin
VESDGNGHAVVPVFFFIARACRLAVLDTIHKGREGGSRTSRIRREAMKVRVDPDLCTGCGPCEAICPEVFEMRDDKSVVILKDVPPELEDAVREAADSCPANAIIVEEK